MKREQKGCRYGPFLKRKCKSSNFTPTKNLETSILGNMRSVRYDYVFWGYMR